MRALETRLALLVVLRAVPRYGNNLQIARKIDGADDRRRVQSGAV
jgi:hypothetical protein